MSPAVRAWGAELLVLVGTQDDDLAGGMVEQPRDGVGVEAVTALSSRCDDDPVKPLVGDCLPERVAVGAPALDAGVDRHAELDCAVLDRLLQWDCDLRLVRE